MVSSEGVSSQDEGNLTTELTIIPKELVFTPQQFDQLVLSGQFPPADLLGCHVTALARVAQDFQEKHMDRKEWLQLFPKKIRTLGIGRFKRKFGGYYVDPITLIRENRAEYGSSAGSMDALSERHPELATNPHLYGSIADSFYNSPEARDVLKKQAEERKGVQLIYGGEGFFDYLDKQNQRQDPEWFGVVRIDRRVPSSFITAVIPLGPYEQQALASL